MKSVLSYCAGNGCSASSASGILSDGALFVLVMAVTSAVLVLLISYATLASHRRRFEWLPSCY